MKTWSRKSVQWLCLKINNLLNIRYLPDRQNLMSIKQLSRYSLKNSWACLGKFGHTKRNVTASVYSPGSFTPSDKKTIPNSHVVKEILHSEKSCYLTGQ